MVISAWVDLVRSAWEPVQFQEGITARMLLTTVLDGLNQGELRDAMQQWWRTLVKEPTLEQLEDMLYQKQQQ
jgi:hypothetical protein